MFRTRTVLAILAVGVLTSFVVYCGNDGTATNDGGSDGSSVAETGADTASTDACVAAPPPSGNVNFSPAAGCVTGAQTICLYSGTSCGNNIAGTAIFYTLDGSPANEASQLYTGPITLPNPTSTRTVVINAVLVQMQNTTLAGCSHTNPCYGVIVQDGMNVKANLNTNVSCPATGTGSCPPPEFDQSDAAVMPPVQYGDCTSAGDRGVRGVPSAAWYYVSQPQPTVDPYVNSSLSVEMELAVTNAVDCGPGTAGLGDTEFLIPAIRNKNQLPDAGGGIGCDQCTSFATSFYVAHDYEGDSGTTLDPANLSELEMDQNQVNAAYNTATTYGYGTFNMRSSMSNAPSVTVGSNTYGQWQYSSQSVNWDTFQHFFPSVTPVTHDSPMPFGKLATALAATGCPSNSSFTPGVTNTLYHGGENSYGVEPGFLLVDQGTPTAESILLIGSPGGAVMGCVRGAGGTTAYPHASGALASLTVKVQAHATQGVGPTAASGCIGSSAAENAMYMDYLSLNGNYYGTGASSGPNYQALMGLGLPQPSITVLDTWGTQSVGGVMQSKVCSWFSSGAADDKFFNQKQPYTKPGTGNAAKIGIFDMHDNVTASWGIIGSPSQAIYTQAPPE